jgi:hypothetical protein
MSPIECEADEKHKNIVRTVFFPEIEKNEKSLSSCANRSKVNEESRFSPERDQ